MQAARALAAVALWLCTAAAAAAQTPGLRPLDDSELSQVRGRDGLAFNLVGFSLTSDATAPLTLTYRPPQSTDTKPYSLALSGLRLSRSDDDSPFTDPYTLDIVSRTGLSDVIRLGLPLNASGRQLWQFGADLAITAGGSTFNAGNLSLNDLGLFGGALDISTPSQPGIEGVAFGLSTKLSLGSLQVRPRGAADASEQLTISGVRLADAATGGPWALSDITRQPGLFNAVTDLNGQSALHLQIAWPTTSDPVPAASLVIDRIAFQSGGQTYDYGSSRIGAMQLQYVDIKFRAGP